MPLKECTDQSKQTGVYRLRRSEQQDHLSLQSGVREGREGTLLDSVYEDEVTTGRRANDTWLNCCCDRRSIVHQQKTM